MAVGHDINTWLRRSDAAKRLGVSVTQLRRYEHGRITPILDANGDNRFDPTELDALARKLRRERAPRARPAGRAARGRATVARRGDAPPPRASGVTTRRAFELFETHHSKAQVAMELEEPIETVNWLYENWLVMSGQRADGAHPAHGPPSGTPRRFRMIIDTLAEARPPHLRSEGEREVLRIRDEVDARERLRRQAEEAAERTGAAEASSAAGAHEAQDNPPDDGPRPSEG